jgi:tRNA A37 threonylcarbamoyladenosine dehydratase
VATVGQRFGGLERLYGRGSLERLSVAHVCVVGVGGVGSWTVEALARSGIGALTIVDLDDVCVTNVNRQLPALDGNIGRPKVEVLSERVRAINPDCRVTARSEFFTESSASDILGASSFDYVVDAIDSLKNKCLLVVKCLEKGIPLITSGAAGGRSDPTQIKIDDLAFTTQDELLRYVRKRLRRDFGFTRDVKKPFGVKAVFSIERAVFPWSDGRVCHELEKGSDPAINCEGGVGTASFVTGAFGFVAAAEVVGTIAKG